jgi:hypothetical protein
LVPCKLGCGTFEVLAVGRVVSAACAQMCGAPHCKHMRGACWTTHVYKECKVR